MQNTEIDLENTSDFSIESDEIKETGFESHFNQNKVKHLHADYYSGDLNLQPDFQREFVWNKVKASSLIGSIFLAESKGKYEVVDGQQRLTSIFSFMDGTFPNDKGQKEDFRLSKIEGLSELRGKRFRELTERQQTTIKNYQIPVITINSEKYPQTSFLMLERINSGSIKLNAQELRNC